MGGQHRLGGLWGGGIVVEPTAETDSRGADMSDTPSLDGSPPMKFNPRTIFRAIAFAESVSWAGLLVGIYLKRVAETTEVGVTVMGPIHGVIVLTYLVVVFYSRRTFGWNARTALMAASASVPPFATVVFEVWADRRNLLQSADSFSEERASAAR